MTQTDFIEQAQDTHMYNEIFQQSTMVEKTLTYSEGLFPDFYELLLKNGKQLHIFGSGTSYHAGLAGGIAITNTLQQPVYVNHASEWIYTHPSSLKGSGLAIAISQSGESSDVVFAAKHAKNQGLDIVSITNVEGSTLDELGTLTVITPAGKEQALAATKSYTTALAILLYFATQIGVQEGTEVSQLLQDLTNIPDAMDSVLKSSKKVVEEMVPIISSKNHAFYLGQGSNLATSLEGAMKLKETGNFYSEGYGLREYMHGHAQMTSEETPIIITLSGEEQSNIVNPGIQRLAKHDAPLYVFSHAQQLVNASEQKLLQQYITFDKPIHPLLTPLTLILPLQLLACYNSKARGLNPDQPTKLNKITTFEQ